MPSGKNLQEAVMRQQQQIIIKMEQKEFRSSCAMTIKEE